MGIKHSNYSKSSRFRWIVAAFPFFAILIRGLVFSKKNSSTIRMFHSFIEWKENGRFLISIFTWICTNIREKNGLSVAFLSSDKSRTEFHPIQAISIICGGKKGRILYLCNENYKSINLNTCTYAATVHPNGNFMWQMIKQQIWIRFYSWKTKNKSHLMSLVIFLWKYFQFISFQFITDRSVSKSTLCQRFTAKIEKRMS